MVCLFFKYPPRAESCRVVGGVRGCFLLWGSCCRSRFPSAPSFQQYFKFHYRDVILLEGESCHRVKETCFLLLPSIKFPLYKRKWNKKKLKSFECLSPFPTVYFLSWLLVGRPKSIPRWSRSCDLDHRPVKSMDFYWWWSENLSLVNSVSSHLCSGIIWWVDRSEKQQQEALSSIAYIYFTWNKVFWVPLETFLLPGLSTMVCYL